MGKPGMTITGDISSLVNFLQNLEKRKMETATAFMQAMTFHASERAEANAPIKTGLLRSTIRPIGIVADTTRVTGGVASALFYAGIRHDAVYNLGKISRAQPKTVEGTGPGTGPGRLYILNVLKYHNSKYLKMLDTMTRAMLAGMQGAWTSVLQPKNLWHAQSGEGE